MYIDSLRVVLKRWYSEGALFFWAKLGLFTKKLGTEEIIMIVEQLRRSSLVNMLTQK